MTEMEQDTIKPATRPQAHTRFSTLVAKPHNRMVTTEHMRRQTQDGKWCDSNTYQLPTYTQHELRKVIAAQHEANYDVLHTMEDMANTVHYTAHTEADHRGSPYIRNRSYLLLPQSTVTQRNRERRMQRAAI